METHRCFQAYWLDVRIIVVRPDCVPCQAELTAATPSHRYKAPPGTSTTPAIPALIAHSQAQAFNHTHLVPTRASSSSVSIYGVPYSEHSSFLELTCFALSLDWVRMIATVNVGSARGREKINGWVEKWKTEREKRRREGQGIVVSSRNGDYW